MILLPPKAAGRAHLDPSLLKEDRRAMTVFGPCGLGRNAIYLGSGLSACRLYIPYSAIERVYKRLVLSSCTSISSCYLVVELADGQERKCLFSNEEDVDHLIASLKHLRPGLKFLSASAEKALTQAEEEERKRYRDDLDPEVEALVRKLEADRLRLEGRVDLYSALSAAARRLRNAQLARPRPSLPIMALAMLAILMVFGSLVSMSSRSIWSIFFLVGTGLSVTLVITLACAWPSRRDARAEAERAYREAVAALEEWKSGVPSFPLPAIYCHPAVLARTIRVLKEGRAADFESAFALMRDELKMGRNTSMLSQKDYDEAIEAKPLFQVSSWA